MGKDHQHNKLASTSVLCLAIPIFWPVLFLLFVSLDQETSSRGCALKHMESSGVIIMVGGSIIRRLDQEKDP